MRVERTRQADDDLIAIYVYGYEQFGTVQAETYHAELVDTFQLLAEAPLICPERREFVPPVRIHHHGRHLIIYTV